MRGQVRADSFRKYSLRLGALRGRYPRVGTSENFHLQSSTTVQERSLHFGEKSPFESWGLERAIASATTCRDALRQLMGYRRRRFQPVDATPSDMNRLVGTA